MPKDDWVYIGHILDLCHQAKEIIAGKQRKNYDQEIVFKLALTYLIRVISEAAQQVSRDFQEKTHKSPGVRSSACGIELCTII